MNVTRYFRKKNLILIVLLCLTHLIFANDTLIVIPEVKLKTDKTDDRIRSESSQTSGFTREQIVITPEALLSGLLHEQSVIRLTNSSGDSSQIIVSIRGFGDNAAANSLILVDGFPLMNPSLLAPNFNMFILPDIQNIKIIQGSQGSLYGNQAVGGVLSITTRHPEKFFADVYTGYGSYNRKYVSAIVGNKLDNGIFYKLSGYTNESDNYRVHNAQANNGFASQLGVDYARGLIAFNQRFSDDTIEFPGGLTEEQYEQDPRQASDFSNFSEYKTQIYQLLSKHQLNDEWLLETRLQHNQVNGDGFIYSNFENAQSIDSLNPQVTGFLGNNQLIVGYNGQLDAYDNENAKVQNRVRDNENDVYSQIMMPIITKRLDFTLGGRAAWQNNAPELTLDDPVHYTNQVLVSEQGLTYHLNPTVNLYLRRDGNFRFPKANEQVWLAEGVTTLEPQTGVSYETGTDWETLKQHAQLNLYILQLHDELAFDPTQTETQPFGAISNLDKTLREGITTTEDYHITSTLDLKGQVNYVNARFDAGDNEGCLIPAVPAWNNSVLLGYRFLPRWRASYTALYNGSAYASEDVSNAGKKVPGYWLSRIALQYFFKYADVNFEVNNVFNQRYSLYTVYDPTTQQNTYYPGAGRNFLLTLKASIH